MCCETKAMKWNRTAGCVWILTSYKWLFSRSGAACQLCCLCTSVPSWCEESRVWTGHANTAECQPAGTGLIGCSLKWSCLFITPRCQGKSHPTGSFSSSATFYTQQLFYCAVLVTAHYFFFLCLFLPPSSITFEWVGLSHLGKAEQNQSVSGLKALKLLEPSRKFDSGL